MPKTITSKCGQVVNELWLTKSLCPIQTIIIYFRIRKALENRTNMEDDRVGILESQLSQAKLIAEEADKKYEEVPFYLLYTKQR